MHGLLEVLVAAADGRFPPADGAVEVLAPDADGTCAVVAFTGHAFVLGDVGAGRLAELGADGYGGALHPDVQRELAGAAGSIGSVDVVLARRAGGGTAIGRTGGSGALGRTGGGAALGGWGGGGTLGRRLDADDHPRVVRARAHRRDVEVFGDDAGLVVTGIGLAGRRELSVELTAPAGRGHGRRLIAGGLATLPPGEWCFAQVAAGNAASLRAFLACGFVPLGAEVLITPG